MSDGYKSSNKQIETEVSSTIEERRMNYLERKCPQERKKKIGPSSNQNVRDASDATPDQQPDKTKTSRNPSSSSDE